MCKFLFGCSGLILAINGGLASAQDLYGTYPHRDTYTDSRFAPADRATVEHLRWRPLDDEPVDASKPNRTGRPTGMRDYTDEPFGLPRGTYRRIEERHTITPHREGYRFRPIDPEEQVRNRSRNETQNRVKRDQAYSPSGRDIPSGYGRSRRAPAPDFRPDPRLDKGSTEAPSRYAFPMGSDAPMFRPR